MTLALLLFACGSNATGLSAPPDEQEGVVGTVTLSLSADQILILDAQVGYSKDAAVTATSAGDADLKVYEVNLLDNAAQIFYFEEPESQLVLAPGQSVDWRVVATLPTEEPAFATLRIRTSDPDASELRLPVAAYPIGQEPPEDTGGQDSGGQDSGGSDSGA
jgi:hypothetical protein